MKYAIIFLLCLSSFGCREPETVIIIKENHTPAQSEKYQPVPEKKSVAQLRHEEKLNFAQKVRVDDIPEEPELSGMETTHMAVKVKSFDDEHVLRQVRYILLEYLPTGNYTVTSQKENRRGFSFKLWSELTPLLLSERIKKTLFNYEVRVEQRRKGLLVITLEKEPDIYTIKFIAFSRELQSPIRLLMLRLEEGETPVLKILPGGRSDDYALRYKLKWLHKSNELKVMRKLSNYFAANGVEIVSEEWSPGVINFRPVETSGY